MAATRPQGTTPSRREMIDRLAEQRGQAQVSVSRRRANTVQVWPHLMIRQFIATVVITLNTLLLGVLINAPLVEIANPEKTPNPSKAPWYFLNLQELLLHMNPALAGVIIPSLALGALAAIPYIDNKPEGTGVWFYSNKGIPVFIFSFLYTLIAEIALVLIDAALPAKQWIGGLIQGVLGAPKDDGAASFQGQLLEALSGWFFPIGVIALLALMLGFLVRMIFKANKSEIVIAMFTGFVASYVLLTIIGTAFRGHSMSLLWPWALGETS